LSDQSTENNPTPEVSIAEEINKQTGVITWPELLKHFARGVVLYADETLDLVEVARSMSVDDTVKTQKWLAGGQLRRASDDDARDWTKNEPEFWCVVVAPWVLVQLKQPKTLQ